MSPAFSGIVAMDAKRGIGIGNKIPWRLPEDLKLFKSLTMGHPILMGRKTWESLGRPLPGRQNIVLSRSADFRAPGAAVIGKPEDLERLDLMHPEIMVIGGAQVYALLLPRMQKLYVSEVAGVHDADTWFPPFAHLFRSRTLLRRFDGFDSALYER